MRENGYNETHFKVLVVSEVFKPKVIILLFKTINIIFIDASSKTQNGLRFIR